MKIAVWDTYVKLLTGKIMHFDILVAACVIDEKIIFSYGHHYLTSKLLETFELTSNECRFCHIELATKEMIESIDAVGYAIIEMENCE